MTASIDKNISRLRIELRGLEIAFAVIEEAKDSVDGHLGWANFVRHFKLASDLVMRIAKQGISTRAEAWRSINLMKTNEILRFIRRSRDDIDHPEDEKKDDLVSGNFERTCVSVGRISETCYAFRVPEGCNASFTGCSFNGRPFEGVVGWKGDGTLICWGTLDTEVQERGFYPKKIRTIKGNVIHPPTDRYSGLPLSGYEIAKLGKNWLTKKLVALDLIKCNEKVS